MPETTSCNHCWIPVQTGSTWFDCLTGQIQDNFEDMEICNKCFEMRQAVDPDQVIEFEIPF